jgi:hypothetical protein
VEQPHFPKVSPAGQSESEQRFVQSFGRKPKEYDLGFDRDTHVFVAYLVDRKLGLAEKRVKDDARLTQGARRQTRCHTKRIWWNNSQAYRGSRF